MAKLPVKLLSISRPDYDDLIRDGVAAAYKLAYNVVEDVASRLRRMDEWIAELSNHNGVCTRPTSNKHARMAPVPRQAVRRLESVGSRNFAAAMRK